MTQAAGGGSGFHFGKLAAQPRVAPGSQWQVAQATGFAGSGDLVHHRSPSATKSGGPERAIPGSPTTASNSTALTPLTLAPSVTVQS